MLADVRQRDVGDRQVEVGDRRRPGSAPAAPCSPGRARVAFSAVVAAIAQVSRSGAAARRRPVGMKCALDSRRARRGRLLRRARRGALRRRRRRCSPRGRRPDGRLPRGARGRRPRARARRSAPGASRCRSRSAACPCTASSCRGRWPRGCARSPAARRSGHDRRLLDRDRRRDVLGRLPRLQHDQERDDAGRAGGVFPQRRGAPRAGRLLRHRDGRAGPAAAPARRDAARVPPQRDPLGHRRVRRREPGPHLAPLRR